MLDVSIRIGLLSSGKLRDEEGVSISTSPTTSPARGTSRTG
jgi:hypothetical protein